MNCRTDGIHIFIAQNCGMSGGIKSYTKNALTGAMDIIAEKISDDADIRKRMRFVCHAHGILTVKAITEDIGVYEMYKDYSEPLSKIPDHRILAVNRGEKEGILKVSVDKDNVKVFEKSS